MNSLRVTNKTLLKLLSLYKELSLLGNISALLGWDMEVNLPSGASGERAIQTAYMSKLITEKWEDKAWRRLLRKAFDEKDGMNEGEQAIVRNLERSAKFYLKVPKKLIVEMSRVTSQAVMIWQKARKENKFTDFLPSLKTIIELNIRFADHLGYNKNPYDALLDQYEPGLTTAFCINLFASLGPQLSQIVKAIQSSKAYKQMKTSILESREYPETDQKQIALLVLKKMGYDFSTGRMDSATHPFETQLGRSDIRITNRYKLHNFLESLYGAMHEGGHALYEQGINKTYAGTPLEGGVSLGIHESQSRFWENQIGRNEHFIKWLHPELLKFYPEQMANVDRDTLLRLTNHVHPSLIRTEADEVTYNLHILLRFELENDLINKKLAVADLPEAWREKTKKYLGVVSDTDSDGVLQDIHWAHGTFGYFPTYTLGNLYSAQITHAMKKEIDINKAIEEEKLGIILSWLRTNIHQHGSRWWPAELIKKVSGQPLTSKYFISYLKVKYSKIYGRL